MGPSILCVAESTFARAYIRDLSEYRNRFIPVSRLPPELLSCIFSHLLPVIGPRYYRPMDYGPMGRRDDQPGDQIAKATRYLISVTHVCRRWREIALADSLLWSILPLENRSWLKRMVARSKNTPLTIVQSQSRYAANNHLDVILPSLFRTLQPRRLSIELHYHPFDKLFSVSTILCRPAPLLEILEINFLYFDPRANNWQFLSSHPGNFLGGHAPSLRELTITGPFSYTHLWNLPILRNLVRLSLDMCIDQHDWTFNDWLVIVPNSLPNVLHALKNMDRLRTLTLTMGSSPWHAPELSYFLPNNEDLSAHIVTLPHLSTLILTGHLKDVTALTRHLHLPPTASIEYIVGLQGEPLDDSLLSKLSALVFPTNDSPPAETVDISFARDNDVHCVHEMSFTVKSWHTPAGRVATVDGSGRSKPSFSATFTITAPRHRWEDLPPPAVVESVTDSLVYVLDMVLSFLPLDCVRELRCTAVPGHGYQTVLPLSMYACATILPRFSTTVVTLVLENGVHGFSDLLAALALDRTLLRRLTTIRLIGWEFAVLLHSYTKRQKRAEGVLSLFQANKIADVLRIVASDRGVRLLELHKCNITEFFEEEFEGIADKLVLEECFTNRD